MNTKKERIYKESFVKLINNSAADYYIGRGNPKAKILFIGQEGSEPENKEIISAANWKEQNKLPKTNCQILFLECH